MKNYIKGTYKKCKIKYMEILGTLEPVISFNKRQFLMQDNLKVDSKTTPQPLYNTIVGVRSTNCVS